MIVEVKKAPQNWTRSTNGVLAGVCEGLAKKFDVNPNILRIVWLISVLFFGTGLLVYGLLVLALPREDKLREGESPKLLGVCLKISSRNGIDLGLIRFISLLLAISTFGATMVAYLVLYALLPDPVPKITFQEGT